MKMRFKKILFVFFSSTFLLSNLSCSSQQSEEDKIQCQRIDYCEREDSYNEILAHFVDNTTAILEISKIRQFFIFPTQFFQLTVTYENKTLPLFLVNTTKRELCAMLSFAYDSFPAINDSVVLSDKLTSSTTAEFHQIQGKFRATFPNHREFNEFLQGISPHAYNEKVPFDSLSENLIYQVRCLIPIIYFQQLQFITRSTSSSEDDSESENEGERTKRYSKYDFKELERDDSLIHIGSGCNANCYKIGIPLNNSRQLHQGLIFKNLNYLLSLESIPWELDEFTVFQQAKIEDKSAYSTLNCLVIDQKTGCGVGFLTKYAKYGDLKHFIKNHIEYFDTYFFEQLLELAESLHNLHFKGVLHNDIGTIGNVFVVDRDVRHADGASQQIANYKFLLGDFGSAEYIQMDDSDSASLATDQSLQNHQCNDVCAKYFKSDWQRFGYLLESTFKALALQEMENSTYGCPFLMLIVSLNEAKSYSQLKEYLNGLIMNSSLGTANFAIPEGYKFRADPKFLIVNKHGKNIIYKKGDMFIIESNFEYSLYYVSDDDIESVSTRTDATIVDKINSLAKEDFNVERLLGKI